MHTKLHWTLLATCQCICDRICVNVFACCFPGIIAYLGFGPYEEQGRILWGQPLNYYLIPVMVRNGSDDSLCVSDDVRAIAWLVCRFSLLSPTSLPLDS